MSQAEKVVLLSGGSGFLGTAITEALRSRTCRVLHLTRRVPRTSDEIAWDAEAGRIDRDALARAAPGMVINLAGEPIGQRWTTERRRRIRESRVRGTETLTRALASLEHRPAVLLSGSAIGYYGADRGDTILDESSQPGGDFLALVARDWEDAATPAAAAGIRVVQLRTGLVLSDRGGALPRMLPPFLMGVGGRLGDGRQWMSWIGLTDYLRALEFLLATTAVAGPVNVVAPESVRNEEFTSVLARVLSRPALLNVPAVALGLLFGEMADDTILASQRVTPKRLADAGFEFRRPRLEDALRAELRR